MLNRFLAYYKPHWRLFVLDMTVAFCSVVGSIMLPVLTRQILNVYIPEQEFNTLLLVLGVMAAITGFNAWCQYIRLKWGHILGARMEYDMRADIFRAKCFARKGRAKTCLLRSHSYSCFQHALYNRSL